MILFFGPPGSGKSIQGQLLVERNKWRWLSTGHMFRESSDPEVLARLSTGELLDDELTNRVFNQALADLKSNGDSSRLVVDGYPRNLAQAEWLEGHLPEHGREIEAVIVFEVAEAELLRRLAGRGRAEDTTKVIERRLAIYHQNTKPVIEFYQQHKVPIKIINGQGTVEAVHDRIQQALKECSLE